MEEQIATEDITLEKSVMCTFLEIVEGKQRLRIAMNEGFELKEENGNFFVYKKKGEYPKTYEECCEIMGIEYPVVGGKPDGLSASTYRITEIRPFIYLLICRDAYWKMAGEEMGLGKPWEHDWVNAIYTCTIICRSNKIVKDAGFDADNRILAFPTEEMRDAFYENFKDLIDNCKELL